MNPLNVIGALALASSLGCWVFQGHQTEAVDVTPAFTTLTTGCSHAAEVSANDASFLAQALDPRAPVTLVAATDPPQAASLSPWSSGLPPEPASLAPLTDVFTTPDPFTLALLAGAVVAVVLRREHTV